jgi:hypothetical protein
MTPLEIGGLINQMTFQPDMRLVFVARPRPALHLFQKITDSTGTLTAYPSDRLEAVQSLYLPPLDQLYEAMLVTMVRGMGYERVHHEFDEWFRFRGKLVHDPHAEPQPVLPKIDIP